MKFYLLAALIYTSYSISMDQPLKSALKKKAAEKKQISFSADLKEKNDPFPNVITTGIPGQGKFSPDSSYLVVPVEKKLVVYETQTCTALGDLQNSSTENISYKNGEYSDKGEYCIDFLIFSPQGTYLTDTYHKHVWRLPDRTMIYQGPQPVDMKQKCIGWTPDEKKRFLLNQVTTDNHATFTCQRIDLETAGVEKEFTFECIDPTSMHTSISSNGKLLAFGAIITYWKECYERLFNLKDGHEICAIPQGTETQFTPDNNYALVGTLGAKLMIIDTHNGSILKEVNCDVFPGGVKEQHPPFVNGIEIDAFKALVKLSNHWKKAAFQIPQGARLVHFEETDTTTHSTSGRFILHLCKDQSIDQVMLEDTLKKTKKNLLVTTKPSSKASFSPTDEMVVIESFPEKHVFDSKTATLLYTFNNGMYHFQFSPNGKHLLIYKKDKLEILASFNAGHKS